MGILSYSSSGVKSSASGRGRLFSKRKISLAKRRYKTMRRGVYNPIQPMPMVEYLALIKMEAAGTKTSTMANHVVKRWPGLVAARRDPWR